MRFYHTILAAMMALSLGGCSSGGPSTAGGGGASENSPDAVSYRGRSEIDTLSEDARPQAGGVSVVPSETEDEKITRAEGTLAPVCRRDSETSFHLSGKLFLIHSKDGVETSRVEKCYEGHAKILFWDGHSCQAVEVPAEDCLLSLTFNAEAVEGLKIYGVITLTSQDPEIGIDVIQSLNGSDEADPVPPPPFYGEQMVGKISGAIGPQLAAAQCRPDDPHIIKIDDGIVVARVPDDLPDCGSRERMKLPIKKGSF